MPVQKGRTPSSASSSLCQQQKNHDITHVNDNDDNGNIDDNGKANNNSTSKDNHEDANEVDDEDINNKNNVISTYKLVLYCIPQPHQLLNIDGY